jgi:predicted metal-binding membrane protein
MAPVLRQSRAHAADALILTGLAAACWAVTTVRMQDMGMGMDSLTDLGAVGWFVGVWATMMAAMMLPSLMPVALSRVRARPGASALSGPLLFAAGYLLAWSIAGLVAYALIGALRPAAPGWLGKGAGGGYFAAAVLVGAAAYELTPLKTTCLRLCRAGSPSPGRPRPRAIAPLLNGFGHAGYCVGCCGGLMAALFALGVMSVSWMVVIAAIVAAQKLLPWGEASRWGTAALLVALAVYVAL